MSTIAITSVPVVTTSTAGDVFPIVQNGVTSQITNANLFNSVSISDLTVASAATVQGVTVGKGLGSGDYTTVLGDGALKSNTAGNRHVAVGHNALQATVFSSDNVAVGDSAMFSATTGNRNVGNGTGSLYFNETGSDNAGFGYRSLYNNTASGNTAVGSASGFQITTGANNTIIGNYSGLSAPISQTGSNYVVLSDGAGNVRAYWNGANATFSGLIGTNAAASTIASATTIAPTKSITFISGTTAVVTITVPTSFSAAGGSITLIPTGVFTWTTAGNIALAGTAVVNRALTMTYDSGTAKWYPSYV